MENRGKQYANNFLRKIPLLTSTYLASTAPWLYGMFHNPVETQLTAASLSALIYIIGSIADLKTTMKGLELGAYELNPLLPERPSHSDLINNKQLVSDIAVLIIGMLFPPLGITLGTSKLHSAARNMKAIKESKTP